MKKLTKLLFSLSAGCMLLLSLTLTAFASGSNITYEGQAEKFIFSPGSKYTPTDLFTEFKDVMPGDKLSETITVTNKAKDNDYIKLYMKAVAHDEEGNPLTYSEPFEAEDGKDQAGIDGERDETVVTMADFLAQLSMKIYNGDALIYEASPDELDGLADYVLLGTFRQGESTALTVELEVPIELGNEYANRVGEVDWIFTVEAFNDQTPTPSPTPSPSPSPSAKPEETPAPTDTPDEPQATDTPPQSTNTPAGGGSTGDSMNLGLYVVLVLICVVVLVALRKHLKKQDKEN